MKKIFYILTSFILIFPFLSSAHNNFSLDKILTDIMQSQNIKEKNQIVCEKVTDEQFEELGEALMSLMHPDENEHALMDQMMGGEGSESLKDMHIIMGKRYLRCGDAAVGMPMMQMMGRGGDYDYMMGRNMMGYNSFGADAGWSWFTWILMILFWVLIIAGFIVLIAFWVKKIKNGVKERSALDILKERYAKGEIDRKDFEEMKKELI